MNEATVISWALTWFDHVLQQKEFVLDVFHSVYSVVFKKPFLNVGDSSFINMCCDVAIPGCKSNVRRGRWRELNRTFWRLQSDHERNWLDLRPFNSLIKASADFLHSSSRDTTSEDGRRRGEVRKCPRLKTGRTRRKSYLRHVDLAVTSILFWIRFKI